MLDLYCEDCDGPLKEYIDLEGLSNKHKIILFRFVEKFRKGALEHDDIDNIKDWTPDIIEELVDAVFYLIFQLEGLRKIGGIGK